MRLSWRSTYDVHDCPSCGGEHPERRVWVEERRPFVVCPRTWRRVRIRMRPGARVAPSPVRREA